MRPDHPILGKPVARSSPESRMGWLHGPFPGYWEMDLKHGNGHHAFCFLSMLLDGWFCNSFSYPSSTSLVYSKTSKGLTGTASPAWS